MLDFLFAPTFDTADGCFGGVAVDALQIIDIVRRIVFDERRSLDRGEQWAVDFRGIKARPLDVVESPAFAINCPIGHPQTPWPMLTTEHKILLQQQAVLQTSRFWPPGLGKRIDRLAVSPKNGTKQGSKRRPAIVSNNRGSRPHACVHCPTSPQPSLPRCP